MRNGREARRRKIWLHEYLVVSDILKVKDQFKTMLCHVLGLPPDEHDQWLLVDARHARAWLHVWHEELILGRRIYREPDFLLVKVSLPRDQDRPIEEILTQLPPDHVQNVMLIEVEVRITRSALIQVQEYSYIGMQARQHLYRLSSKATLRHPFACLTGLVIDVDYIPFLSPRGISLQILHPDMVPLIPHGLRQLHSIHHFQFPSTSVIGTWQRMHQETNVETCRRCLMDERWNPIERFLLMALHYTLGSDVMRQAVEQVERERQETLEEMQARLIEELRRAEEEHGELVEIIAESLPVDFHRMLLHYRDPPAMSVILRDLTPAQLEYLPEEVLVQLPDSVLERLPDSVLERLPDSVLERLPDSVLERLSEEKLLYIVRNLWPKEKREHFIRMLISTRDDE